MSVKSSITTTSFSIPKSILAALDKKRRDFPRSRFVLRILEKSLLEKSEKYDADSSC
jgi:hypothetical protein